MKILSFFLMLFLVISCKPTEPTEVESSRKILLSYEKDGYQILLNKKQIKIDNMFLDGREIIKVKVNEDEKSLSIIRKDTILHLMNLLSVADNQELEKQLVFIDGRVFESKDFERIELEMSAVKSVRVKKDTLINGKKYNRIVFLKTFNNDR